MKARANARERRSRIRSPVYRFRDRPRRGGPPGHIRGNCYLQANEAIGRGAGESRRGTSLARNTLGPIVTRPSTPSVPPGQLPVDDEGLAVEVDALISELGVGVDTSSM